MQLSNKCCNLVFSCMQQNFENLKCQFQKEKIRFVKMQNESEINLAQISAKMKNYKEENKILRNEMNLMKLNLDWTNRRNQILKKKLIEQEKMTQDAVNVAVKNAIETFKINSEKLKVEMNRATKLNENLKSEIEMLKAQVQYFKSNDDHRPFDSPKRNFIAEISSEEISDVSSMADFQWELNSLTGNSEATFYPESFADDKQAFASKEFDSFDSDIDSMETVDTIWMENEINRLEDQMQEMSKESKIVKNELKQAQETISKLAKDLCSVILDSKV